ncbi:MAG: hypothetical protein E7392_04520 [Ruminococcaceae bacterium]|nr:hypothetical protein [Oscillospiraceae bacterium]
MKKAKLSACVLVIALFISSFTFTVNAQDISVKVKIAPFYTEIDYMSVDNRYVEYPLITYKDITYFPMTFDLCARLGLACGFDSEKGLFITREYIVSGNIENPKPFGGDALNYYNTSYDAVVPTYPIYLNGIFIDNEKEQYPLLNFRGVTYFPMTWRFAYEELCFDIEWSDEEYSFKLMDNGKSNAPYIYSIEGDNVKLQNKIDVYDEQPLENGQTRYSHLYSYYTRYNFDTALKTVTREENSEKGSNVSVPERADKLTPTVIETTIKDNSIYVGDELLITLDSEEIVSGASVHEYKTGESSLISLSAQIGNAPAPYTMFKEYFFVKDSSGIRQIPWDERSNFNAVYPDNKGGFYISTLGYRPSFSGRWSNSFSDIYYYTPDMNDFLCVTQRYADLFNSMRMLGIEDGKLYFLGMWYDADKNRYDGGPGGLFSAVNSGYYTIDLESGELTKLYAYICGETFFGPDKNLYCVSNCARVPRIVNLNTGKIIPVK